MPIKTLVYNSSSMQPAPVGSDELQKDYAVYVYIYQLSTKILEETDSNVFYTPVGGGPAFQQFNPMANSITHRDDEAFAIVNNGTYQATQFPNTLDITSITGTIDANCQLVTAYGCTVSVYYTANNSLVSALPQDAYLDGRTTYTVPNDIYRYIKTTVGRM